MTGTTTCKTSRARAAERLGEVEARVREAVRTITQGAATDAERSAALADLVVAVGRMRAIRRGLTERG